MTVHDDEPDPTGMRELLRSLPDPGPMPEHLVARIQASLSDVDLHAGRRGATAFGEVPRETVTPRRSSWPARHGPRLAVAAAVLLGGGALASGQLGPLGGSDELSSESTAGGAVADRGAVPDADRDGAAADDATVTGPVTVRLSDLSYSSAGLSTELGSRPPGAQVGTLTGPLAAESPGIGPIGSELGVRSCLEALGLPRATAAAVELARVDGTPAAVLVVTTAGERTAYAVGRSCSTGDPALLAGPVALP